MIYRNQRGGDAVTAQTMLEAERVLDKVRAQVVSAVQASRTNDELIGLAKRQVDAAQEALRLTQTNLQTGTMTTLDVLEAEDALAQAGFRHAEAVVGYNQSQVDLLAALGLIDERSLGLAEHNDDTRPVAQSTSQPGNRRSGIDRAILDAQAP